MSNIYNHLWQSTLFFAAAWVLTLAMRNNRAAVRFRIWFAASVKFLIPFSMLISIGSRFEWRPAALAAPTQFTVAIDQVARPFPAPDVPFLATAPVEHPSKAPAILLSLWAAGCAVSLFSWIAQWRRARAAVRASAPIGRVGDVPILSSPSRMEPGIFGVFRPVLLLPRCLEDRLTRHQIDAILAHELAHARRRDNLTASIHMLVETIFWFHPAVWLIRAKLTEERERACDEAVLSASVEPEIYAEGILNVCKYYLESRLACVAGVSGANLKKRIEAIMTDRGIARLTVAKRFLVSMAAIAAVAGPVAVGLLNAPAIRAQQSFAFDVASIKPNHSQDRRIGFNFAPGRFTATKLPLDALIALAYDLPLYGQSGRIAGGPDWVRTENFDVEGKAEMPAGLSSKAREARMKLMLQTLLADRFQLTLRRETRDLPFYALTVAKNGPKLVKAKIEEKDCPEGRVDSTSCHVINGGQGRGLHAKAADMNDVALFVANWTDRPLIDKTGLSGLYELDTEGWASMRTAPPRPDGVPTAEDLAQTDPTRRTLFMIFDGLGLKMEAQKGPVEMFTIEKAERPTAN